MRKITSITIGLVIATILTAYMSTLTFAAGKLLVGDLLAGHKGQAGDILAQEPQPEHIPLTPLTPPHGLGCSPLDPRC